jgi:hypothetical protein
MQPQKKNTMELQTNEAHKQLHTNEAHYAPAKKLNTL